MTIKSDYIPASERMKPAFRLRRLRQRWLDARDAREHWERLGNDKWISHYTDEMQRIEREGKRLKDGLT